MIMPEIKGVLRLVWDADAVQRGIAAWKRMNYRLMQERDERKRAARRAAAQQVPHERSTTR
jgi:hypothetical protein